MMMVYCEVPIYNMTKEKKSSELSAIGAKRGVRSLPMRTVPSRRSTKAQPAEGRPGPSDFISSDKSCCQRPNYLSLGLVMIILVTILSVGILPIPISYHLLLSQLEARFIILPCSSYLIISDLPSPQFSSDHLLT